jgi:dTDP-4-amino-4,6-dideoxygalactose transaminase
MRKNGIGVQVNYIPAYRHPVFQKSNLDVSLFPNSELFYSQAISLPMFTQLTKENLFSISKALQNVI